MSKTEEAIQTATTALAAIRAALAPITSAFPLSDEQAARIIRIEEALVASPSGREGLDLLLGALDAANLVKLAVEKLFRLSPAQRIAHDESRAAWKVCYDLWKVGA